MQSSPATSSLLGPNILLSTLFSDTLSVCSSLCVRVQFHTHTKIMVKGKGKAVTVLQLNATP
jgi:hypothetical protein